MANVPKKIKSGIEITGTATLNSEDLLTDVASQTVQNKTIDASNTIAEGALPSTIDAAKIADGSVSNAEFQTLDGVTSGIQGQLDAKAASADLASTANGNGASLIGVEDAGAIFAATNVEGVLAEIQSNVASAQAGINMKDAVQVASTGDLTLSGEQTIDGVLTSASRVLVKDQTDPIENGIYVTASGAWVRATDFDGDPATEVKGGNLVYTQEGTVNANTQFILQGNADNKVVDTDPLIFSIFSRAEAIVAGTGLNKSGLTLSVDMNDFTTTDLAEGTNLYFTDERARDAAGAMATDSSKVSLTYDDVADTLTPDIVAGSLVDADINAAAGIDATKIGNGDVDNSELSHLNGVTSAIQTQLDAKLDLSGGTMTGSLVLSGAPTADLESATKKYVDDEIVAAEGANKTLSNLTSPTSVNQSLLSSDGTQSIGGTSGDHFSVVHSNSQEVGYSAQGKTIYKNSGSARVHVGVENSTATPSGGSASSTFRTVDPLAGNIGVFTSNDSANNASASPSVLIETGNKSAGTGDSGSINLTTGTSVGGARGSIILDGAEIDASTSKIVNVVDPTLDQDAATKKYVDDAIAAAPSGSAGDIDETSFSMANNQTTAADVVGLAFASGTVRSAKVLASVEIDATADLYESFELLIIQKGADFDMSISAVGDNSNVNFSITSSGQVQYTSGNEAGFVSGTIKFRAITTTV